MDDSKPPLPVPVETSRNSPPVLSIGRIDLAYLPGKTIDVFYNITDRFIIEPEVIMPALALLSSIAVLIWGTWELLTLHDSMQPMNWYIWNGAIGGAYAIAQAVLNYENKSFSGEKISTRAVMIWIYIFTSLSFYLAAAYTHSFDYATADEDMLMGCPAATITFALLYGFYVSTWCKQDMVENPQRNQRRLSARSAMSLMIITSGLFMVHCFYSVMTPSSVNPGALSDCFQTALLIFAGSVITYVFFYKSISPDLDYGVKNIAERFKLR